MPQQQPPEDLEYKEQGDGLSEILAARRHGGNDDTCPPRGVDEEINEGVLLPSDLRYKEQGDALGDVLARREDAILPEEVLPSALHLRYNSFPMSSYRVFDLLKYE